MIVTGRESRTRCAYQSALPVRQDKYQKEL